MRGKFRCCTVTKHQGGMESAMFVASTDAEWSKYTPNGKLEIDITNDALYGSLTPGKQYFLDITEVAEEEQK